MSRDRRGFIQNCVTTYVAPVWVERGRVYNLDTTIWSRLTSLRHRGLFLFCPRMGLVVDAGQVLKVQVGVNLGGGDVGVAEQFLHGPQVAG